MKITVAMLGFALMLVPIAARADAQALCNLLGDPNSGVASETSVFTTGTGDDGSATYTDFKNAMDAYQSDLRYFFKAHCSNYDNSLYTVSFLDLLHAWLLHEAKKSWQDPTELAIQQLTRCASVYFGTERGASCSNWQEKAIGWKMQWEQAASNQ
jgi:hypothetical protein